MKAFNKIKTEYLEFRKKLENDIKGNQKLNPSEDCCLIEESFIKEIVKNDISPNLSNSYPNVNQLKKNPIIINDFDDAINHINSNIKLKLVCIKIFELMGFKNILKNNNIVNYYGGNKKLIIEFKVNGGNKAIFVNNYSTDIQIKNNIFIINKSKELYRNILYNITNINNKEIINFYNYIGKSTIISMQKNIDISQKINYPKNKMENSDYNTYSQQNSNISISYNFANKNQKEIKENDNQEDFKKDLIKIFIYIFYYEKICSEKKSNIFNNKEKYYIINPNWLVTYKKYYNFQTLESLLKKENIDLIVFNLDKFEISNKLIDDIAQN